MSKAKQRVAITGIGVLTPIGHGPDGLWQGLRRGRSAVRTITRFDASPFRSRMAAEIDDFDPHVFLGEKRARRLDRYSQFGVAVGLLAARDAGFEAGPGVLPKEAGCYVGSALGGVAFAEEQHRRYIQSGVGGVSPSLALAVFGGAAASNVAIELGLHGPSLSNSNSCASGAVAIGEAFRLVRDGHAPLMLAGGVETPLAPLTFGAFAMIKAMSAANACPERSSRPFDAARDGFVMGEGAAMLVLEPLDAARARGARVYAEVRGYGTTNDAHHMLAPLEDGSQAARAITLALEDAGVRPEAVDYVNAHASATPIGDRAEAAAIRLALGTAHAARVPVSGTKGLYGHPLGAAGAVEAAISALAIREGWLPGTGNLTCPEPDLGLNLLGPEGLASAPEVVLSNSFGFGGINAALVLARAES